MARERRRAERPTPWRLGPGKGEGEAKGTTHQPRAPRGAQQTYRGARCGASSGSSSWATALVTLLDSRRGSASSSGVWWLVSASGDGGSLGLSGEAALPSSFLMYSKSLSSEGGGKHGEGVPGLSWGHGGCPPGDKARRVLAQEHGEIFLHLLSTLLLGQEEIDVLKELDI